MEHRQNLLDQKAAEIRTLLDGWAKDAGIVQLGERLVFSLKIEGFPIVARDQEDTEAVLAMMVGDFFSKERVQRHTLSPHLSTRIPKAIKDEAYWRKDGVADPETETMKDFLASVTKSDLLRTPNVGETCVRVIGAILGEVGLSLRER